MCLILTIHATQIQALELETLADVNDIGILLYYIIFRTSKTLD